MNKKNTYKHIYKLYYIATIKGCIKETQYISVIQKLCDKGFKTYHIENFTDLILNFHNLNLFDSYNISLLLYLRDIYFKRITEFLQIFKYSNKEKIIEKIKEIKAILIQKLKIIQSFKKLERYENALLTSINNGVFNIVSWENYTKEDIINRLLLIKKKYFTNKQLKYMCCVMVYLDDLENYTDLETYYIDFIGNIENRLKEYIEHCNIYDTIEEDYERSCNKLLNGDNTMLDMRYYSRILECL